MSLSGVMGPRSKVWFSRTNSNETLLTSVRELVLGKEKWTLEALDLPGDRGFGSTSVTSDANTLYNCSLNDARSCISKLVSEDSTASEQLKAESQAYLAGLALDDWRESRQSHRTSRIGRGIQGFLCTVGAFLQSFSGVAEIVKAADQQFGGLAYGTVVLVAIVAANKQRREEAIEETLEELAHAFPRLATLDELEPENTKLQALILKAFELAIQFCRETLAYFMVNSFERIIKAVKPKEMRMLIVSRLHVNLAEIRKECEISMLRQLAAARHEIRDLRSLLHEIRLTGTDTNIRVRKGQEWMSNTTKRKEKDSYLSDVKKYLKIHPALCVPSQQVAADVACMLKDVFGEEWSQDEIGEPMTDTFLEEDGFVRGWVQERESSVLLLGGDNLNEDSQIELNWLSAISVWLTRTTTMLSTITFAVFCQHRTVVHNRRSFADVIRSLLYQLAETSSLTERPQLGAFEEALSNSRWQGEDADIICAHLLALLEDLLTAYRTESTIVIVIDRLDRCGWSGDKGIMVNVERAVRSLLNLVVSGALRHLTVKVLLVMDNVFAEKISTTLGSWKGRGLEVRTGWDQSAAEGEDD